MFSNLLRTQVRKSSAPRAILTVEALESRLTPYVNSGNLWLQPQLLSLSFMPDGTNLGGVTSNLFSTMDAKWATSVWQKEILRSAQVYAQQTNINFTVVSDDGSVSGSGDYQQGAGNFGDIRIGAFASSGGSLGTSTFPQPACNYSAGGDFVFNSNQPWVINQTGGYDLFTVSAHEIGHSLGLGHSTQSTAVLYSLYTGIKSSLRTDDINGIRNIYSGNSARLQDSYDASSANGSFATATDVTGTLAGDLTSLVTDRDITTTSDLDYYKVTAPAGTTGTLVVKIQSSGLSLLSPLVKVYNAAQQEIGSASGLNQYGATLTVTINGVAAGQDYYVMVDGADATAFGTGKYAMTLNFGSAASPTVPLPNTQTANGSPLTCGGGIANKEHDDDHDHDHDHDHGTAPVVSQDTALVQFLNVRTTGTTVAAAPATLREVQPAIQAVDQVFAAAEADATEVEAADATTEQDELFANLFA